jgi:hypothetical protein
MLTLTQFINKWTGKFLDFDGVYGGQCVDVILGYCHDVLNFALLPGNAIDEFGENPNHWTWVINDPSRPDQLPPHGAVIIWHEDHQVGTGVLGHTAICINAYQDHFISFDQNWPIGSPCHQVRHTYQGVKGWGIPKPLVPAPAPVPVPVPIPVPIPVTPPPGGWAALIAWLQEISQ